MIKTAFYSEEQRKVGGSFSYRTVNGDNIEVTEVGCDKSNWLDAVKLPDVVKYLERISSGYIIIR